MTKKHAATLLVLMMVALTSLVNAQTPAMIKAQVPFNFIANSKTMPAGEYIITVLNNGRAPILAIRNGQHGVLVLPHADQSSTPNKKTVLVFHGYGNRYVLASINREGSLDYQLPTSKLERELQARNIGEHEFTLLASSR